MLFNFDMSRLLFLGEVFQSMKMLMLQLLPLFWDKQILNFFVYGNIEESLAQVRIFLSKPRTKRPSALRNFLLKVGHSSF